MDRLRRPIGTADTAGRLEVTLRGNTANGYYLHYDSTRECAYAVNAKLNLNDNGRVRTVDVDRNKLTLVDERGVFEYSPSKNLLYAVKTGGLSSEYKVYFTYSYNNMTFKSKTFSITLEPILGVTNVTGGRFNVYTGDITLPAQSGTLEFTVEISPEAAYTLDSRLTLVRKKTGITSMSLTLTYNKTPSAGPATIRLKTPGGQELKLTCR